MTNTNDIRDIKPAQRRGVAKENAFQIQDNGADRQNDIASALAVGCPILATVKAMNPKMTSVQSAAAKTLALACPPNSPPTSAMVAVADLVQAYAILQPLLAGK